MFRKVYAVLFLLVGTLAQAVEFRAATFNIGAHLVIPASGSVYFDYGLGDPGTPDFDNVLAVLSRINADVVALQEIHSADVAGNADDVDALAAALGYPYIFVSPTTNTFDTSLRVIFLSRFPFLTSSAIGSPAGTKEITRLFPAVRVDVPGTTRDPLMVAAHLKSGTASEDRFRRAVEMRRLTDYLATQGLTADDNYIVMGDFNLSSTNKTFTTLPTGLPSTFALGADIVLPITYSTNPLSYFSNPSVYRLDPRQINNSAATYQSGSVIDLFLVSPAIAGRPLATEIYNSLLDVSNINGLAKSGSPLASGTSTTASDHYALFGDFELDADFPNLSIALSTTTVAEGVADGAVMLTVSLPGIRATALSVNVSTDDLAIASPITVSLTIPAGSVSASTVIRVPRNFIQDEQRSVTFVATASGYDPAGTVLQVSDADSPYAFTAAGQTISETFAGFDGTHFPSPWETASGVWQGIDTGSSAVSGFRAYGTLGDGSIGILADTASVIASVRVINQSMALLRALQISFTAEQWRAVFGGRTDTLTVELLVNGVATPLPQLAFAASTSMPSGPIVGGVSSSKTAVVSGLTIYPGSSFDLRFTLVPGMGGGALPSDVFLNEIHYENDGLDSGEFIEVVVSPGYTGAISNINILLYNGSNGATYGTHALSSFVAGTLTQSMHKIYSKFIPGIQNGNPDGVALVIGGMVRQFLSYEGVFLATDGSATGITSSDLGMAQTTTEVVGQASLGLTGSGGSYSSFRWTKFSGLPHSPGQANSDQTFSVPLLGQGIAIDNVSITFLIDTDLDGIPDMVDLDDDGDESSDLDEVTFGTDPLDRNSRFVMSLVYLSTEPRSVRLSFPTAIGRTYTVESSLDLTVWTSTRIEAGTGAVKVVEFPLAETEKRRFYRMRGTKP